MVAQGFPSLAPACLLSTTTLYCLCPCSISHAVPVGLSKSTKNAVCVCVCVCVCVLSHLVMSDSLQPHGLQPARLLCPWGFSRQEYWSRLPCSPPGHLPSPGIKSRSPALRADSLPAEPPEKPSWSIKQLIMIWLIIQNEFPT